MKKSDQRKNPRRRLRSTLLKHICSNAIELGGRKTYGVRRLPCVSVKFCFGQAWLRFLARRDPHDYPPTGDNSLAFSRFHSDNHELQTLVM